MSISGSCRHEWKDGQLKLLIKLVRWYWEQEKATSSEENVCVLAAENVHWKYSKFKCEWNWRLSFTFKYWKEWKCRLTTMWWIEHEGSVEVEVLKEEVSVYKLKCVGAMPLATRQGNISTEDVLLAADNLQMKYLKWLNYKKKSWSAR